MSGLHAEDQALLDTLPADGKATAIGLLNTYLDGLSPALADAAPSLEPIVSAVLAVCGVPVPTQAGDEPTVDEFGAQQAYAQKQFAIRTSLPTFAPTFARSADALLAALVRLMQGLA